MNYKIEIGDILVDKLFYNHTVKIISINSSTIIVKVISGKEPVYIGHVYECMINDMSYMWRTPSYRPNYLKNLIIV